MKDDWRLRGQEDYMMGRELYHIRFKKHSEEWDHEHCDFCWAKFSEYSGDLHEGYCTETVNNHEAIWICPECCNDFKEDFRWRLHEDEGVTPALITPLGEIAICIDGVPVDYLAERLELTHTCPDVGGRYCIRVSFEPDGKRHTIACRIMGYRPTENDGGESGERLECKAFYHNDTKLSIGMEGDSCYDSGGSRLSAYDYDTGYLDDGVEYEILPFTKTASYLFGLAWMENCCEENEAQTWYGADPTPLGGNVNT